MGERRSASGGPSSPSGGASGAAAAADEALLVAVAGGDRTAFATLFDRYARLVYGITVAVIRDPSMAEEVAQEVLLEAWRTAARFDPDRGSARAWLTTMAHRRAIDRVRSERSSRDRIDRIGRRDLPHPYDDVAERAGVAHDHEQVRAALDHLTERQRQVVELAYFAGHTYREVAEILDTPLGTIKTRMREGLIRLRTELEVST